MNLWEIMEHDKKTFIRKKKESNLFLLAAFLVLIEK